jgi:hypothetical protein
MKKCIMGNSKPLEETLEFEKYAVLGQVLECMVSALKPFFPFL